MLVTAVVLEGEADPKLMKLMILHQSHPEPEARHASDACDHWGRNFLLVCGYKGSLLLQNLLGNTAGFDRVRLPDTNTDKNKQILSFC